MDNYIRNRKNIGRVTAGNDITFEPDIKNATNFKYLMSNNGKFVIPVSHNNTARNILSTAASGSPIGDGNTGRLIALELGRKFIREWTNSATSYLSGTCMYSADGVNWSSGSPSSTRKVTCLVELA